jgi:NAD(P)-dependent dehydrogenase (short-subunit alcohol dehydrogenase family)
MRRRSAIVTGSTSGIGREIAGRLYADGFNVVITGRDKERGDRIRDELLTPTRRLRRFQPVAPLPDATFIPLDLTEAGAPAQLAEAAIEHYGRIDVVVNNAAMDHTDDLLRAPIEDVRHLFEVNTIAAIAVLQEAAKRMEHGGAIINITSRLASIGIPTMSLYSASKGAIKALTTAAAVELAPRNIRVNAVAPGMTRTPLYDTWVHEQPNPEEAERDVVEAIPLRRLATPGDVAAAVSFLASGGATYITGVSLAIDGGYTAR